MSPAAMHLPTQLHAPAKLNLCLFLGSARDDGLHSICSLFEPLTLADLIYVSEAGHQDEERHEDEAGREDETGHDEVVCPGVDGENLAAKALAALRGEGWAAPPLRIEIDKRTPVAAGLGGGSADAAAVLRLAANEVDGIEAVDGLEALAAQLGADVPSQLTPALALVQGAGEMVERLPDPAPHAVVLLPAGGGLRTADVFAEADRLGLARTREELDERAEQLREVAGGGESPLGYADLLVNDLQPAAISLRPDIGDALEALHEAGAGVALVTGSGPTAFGVFPDLRSAEEAGRRLRRPDAIVCEAGRTP